MKLTVYPSPLEGSVTVPGSKSIMQRALAAALLAKGTSIIHQPASSEDCLNIGAVIEQLGAKTELVDGALHVHGGMNPVQDFVHMGESGLGTRMFTPIIALLSTPMTIVGEGSLMTRPMGQFDTLLPALGAACKSNKGKLPLDVQGPLKGGEIEVDGSMSSQFLTGLLMALPLAENDSTLHVKDLKSTPYIDLTLEILEVFGIEIERKEYHTFKIRGKQSYQPSEITIEGDWSAAAAIFAAGAVAGGNKFAVEGLGTRFTQADESVKGALLFAGARLMNTDEGLHIHSHRLRGFEFNASDCPDLFPVLAAMAVFAKKPSTIHGTHRLTHKESNRALAIQEEFAKAGIQVELVDDKMIIHPGKVQKAVLHSHHDHRIAMAAAILGLAGAPITIEDAEAVGKSYPDFFADLSDLGAEIDVH